MEAAGALVKLHSMEGSAHVQYFGGGWRLRTTTCVKVSMNPEFNGPAKLIVTRNFSEKTASRLRSEGAWTKSDYRMSGNRMIITRTEVPDPFEKKALQNN